MHSNQNIKKAVFTALVLAAAQTTATAATTTASTRVQVTTQSQHRATLEANAARAAAEAAKAAAKAKTLDYLYKGAKVTDFAIKQTVKAVPGGSAAYAGGKAVGHVLVHQFPVLAQPMHLPHLPQLPKLPSLPH